MIADKDRPIFGNLRETIDRTARIHADTEVVMNIIKGNDYYN